MSSILEEIETKIAGLKTSTSKSNVGVVRETGERRCPHRRIERCHAQQMIEFPKRRVRARLELGGDRSGAILLGESTKVSEGDEVKTTGKLLQVPVGKALLGRVVNTIGLPLDDKGRLRPKRFYPLEKIAPGVIKRRSVSQPVQTGIMAIDAMIPIGRGQRELIIGDRATGKSTIAIDTIISQARLNKAGRRSWPTRITVRSMHLRGGCQKNSNVARALDVLERERRDAVHHDYLRARVRQCGQSISRAVCWWRRWASGSWTMEWTRSSFMTICRSTRSHIAGLPRF